MHHTFSRALTACGILLAASPMSVLPTTPAASEPAELTALAANSSTLGMGFTLLTEGPAGACASACRALISASGIITADTARRFLAFVRDNLPQPSRPAQAGEAVATVVLDSDGGSVLGAIDFGRAIRRLGFSTLVGRVVEHRPKDAAKYGELRTRADCQSMCAFVLLGGVQRQVPPDARVFVHQIWLGDRRDDAASATYSAEDLVVVQRDIGSIVQYTMEMGGDIELVELSLKVPPWEPMRVLTREELRRTRLDMSDPAAPLPLASNTSAGPVLAEDLPPTGNQPRGWLAFTRAGQPAVGRTHPLTIEGEIIGSFDLFLTCGPAPQTYTFTYSEKRFGPADRGPPRSISQVAVAIGDQFQPLKIASSEKVPRGELESVASVVLPARTVRSLAADGPASMSLETNSIGNPHTKIRVGNAGFGRNFYDLDKSCGQPPRMRNDVRAEAETGASETASAPVP